jgi:hypothetical protein
MSNTHSPESRDQATDGAVRSRTEEVFHHASELARPVPEECVVGASDDDKARILYRRVAAAKKKGPVYAIRPAQRRLFRSGGFCRENDQNGAKVAAIRAADLPGMTGFDPEPTFAESLF